MKLLFAGCEYSGTTTIAHALNDWMEANMGARVRLVHDHFKIPHIYGHPPDITAEQQAQILSLSPWILDNMQRHNIYYHTPYQAGEDDRIVIGLHIEDAVYGPLYFGYGAEGYFARSKVSRQIEQRMLKFQPETVLVHVLAAPDVIRRRMRESPHQSPVLKEGDVEQVLQRFQEEVDTSLIGSKITLDTSSVTVDESVAELVAKLEPFFSNTDRLRLLTHARMAGT